MLKRSFWIVNISKKDVSLGDLNLTIKSRQNIDLLGGNYRLTEDQIIKSAINGSIYNKRDKIKVRKVPPIEFKNHIQIDMDSFMPSRAKNINDHKTLEYDELKVLEDANDDNRLAESEIDILDSDLNAPVIERSK